VSTAGGRQRPMEGEAAAEGAAGRQDEGAGNAPPGLNGMAPPKVRHGLILRSMVPRHACQSQILLMSGTARP